MSPAPVGLSQLNNDLASIHKPLMFKTQALHNAVSRFLQTPLGSVLFTHNSEVPQTLIGGRRHGRDRWRLSPPPTFPHSLEPVTLNGRIEVFQAEEADPMGHLAVGDHMQAHPFRERPQ